MRPAVFPAHQVFALTAVLVFVVTALLIHPPQPIICRGRPVLLPVTERPLVLDERPDDINVELESDANRFINRKWYPDREFNLHMPSLIAANVRSRIVVRADRRLAFGQVRRLLVDIAVSGGDPILLVTEADHR